jgi:hypothetical protein
MQNIFVKPRLIDGAPAVIPDPQGGPVLPADGAYKPRNAFWLRRLRDGDVIEATPVPLPPKPVKAAPPKKSASESGEGET